MDYKEEIKGILVGMGIDGVDEDDFIKKEILTSFEILELVSEMEDKWDIEIPIEMIVPKNLKNIESIAKLIEIIIGESK
jgi:acyl carrier protein